MSDDKSTPDEKVEDQAAEEPLPEESINASAESQRSDVPPQESEEDPEESTEKAPEQSDSAEADTGNSEDNELEEWAQKEGIDFNNPTSEEAKRLAKRLRDTQNKLHQTTQQTSELKKQFTKPEEGYQSTDTEQERLLDEMRLHSFYAERPDAREHDRDMAKIYLDYQETQPDFARYLKRNLNVLHDIARARTGDEKVAQARQKGKKDALESTARSQASAAPKSNATNQADSSKVTVKKVQQWSSNKEDFMKHRDEIMAWEKAQLGLK